MIEITLGIALGIFFFKKHDFDSAKSSFKKSVRSRPDDIQALLAIGNCYDELRRPKLAERYFARALKHLGKDKNKLRNAIVLNLGNALFDQGRMNEAIKQYKKLKNAPLDIQQKAKRNIALARISTIKVQRNRTYAFATI